MTKDFQTIWSFYRTSEELSRLDRDIVDVRSLLREYYAMKEYILRTEPEATRENHEQLDHISEIIEDYQEDLKYLLRDRKDILYGKSTKSSNP